jgi:membrane protein YdbS with pleckstrin-like domain
VNTKGNVDTDPGFRLNAFERLLLSVFKVPEAPQPPDGSPDSIRVFRAGRNYYLWSIVLCVAGLTLAGLTAAMVSLPLIVAIRRTPSQWGELAATVTLLLLWGSYIVTAAVLLVSRRLDYGLRWYIVTDRSLRIRSGIFAVSELTMTYSNVQEIRVSSGPLQLLLGIADVEVQAAGGGGQSERGDSGHIGRFRGVAHANEIRELIVERLRQYRDSGLGEAAHALQMATPHQTDDLAAAKAVLEEASALRAVLETAP